MTHPCKGLSLLHCVKLLDGWMVRFYGFFEYASSCYIMPEIVRCGWVLWRRSSQSLDWCWTPKNWT